MIYTELNYTHKLTVYKLSVYLCAPVIPNSLTSFAIKKVFHQKQKIVTLFYKFYIIINSFLIKKKITGV